MKTLLCMAALTVLLAGCVAPRGTLPPGEAAVRLIGRWDMRGAPDRLVTVNPGSSFEFWYEGTTCAVHVDRSANQPPLPQLWVQFDGTWAKHVVDRDRMVFGEGAAEGRHHVWVVLKAADEHQRRWTPPLVASLTVTGVSAPGGRFVRLPRERRPVLEAVGDSMTEGVLVVRKGKRSEWTEIADARATYAFRAAQALGCEPRIIGFGAQGVVTPGNGGVPPAGLAYPFVYQGVPAQGRPADIVVILHGSNDSKVANVKAGYANLVRQVRRRNPEAAIFCMVPFNQIHAPSLRGAVEDLQAHGDAWVFLVETRGWLDPRTDTTEGVHPNRQGHAKAARRLTAAIRAKLGR
ncbi:MAG: GDSL-type esterase/lipase family protein [Planctomycetota bacterium]